jgi:outer membrane protein OmpA-like peptidoglycan-associated protein
MRRCLIPLVLALILTISPLASQQTPSPGPSQAAIAEAPVEELDETPLFTVDTVSKSIRAVNYQHRSGSTKINFVGTALMPAARGEAKVESKRGYVEVEVEFREVGPATKFGAEYLTYVLWSISPEGRPTNLGEVFVNNNGRAKLNVTSELQVFGMVVTAEPYFAVRVPSDLVVIENEVREDTKGRIFVVEAKYELLERGQYEPLANSLGLSLDLKNVPLDLYQARNAIQIASSSGAEKYAEDVYKRAEASLEMAEREQQRRKKSKQVSTLARQAVQIAEDARALTVRRQQEERLERERQEAAAREEAARLAAEEEARRRAEAEVKREAEEVARRKAEADRAEADRKRLEAELAAARAAAERAQAEAGRAQAQLAQEEARREAARARMEAAEAERLRLEAEQEKLALRRRLFEQFSLLLDTRDTERGLIVNLSDVLFDTGKWELRPVAREKLARLAGILLAYPGLQLEAEGHTDNIGSEEFNQQLSENRANVVREYLISQGIPEEKITAVGRAFHYPVASNDTGEGRQKNRRVEIIVSGEVIGNQVGTPSGP